LATVALVARWGGQKPRSARNGEWSALSRRFAGRPPLSACVWS
jgi:hypothetical protein